MGKIITNIAFNYKSLIIFKERPRYCNVIGCKLTGLCLLFKQEDYRKISVERKGETNFFTSQVSVLFQLLSLTNVWLLRCYFRGVTRGGFHGFQVPPFGLWPWLKYKWKKITEPPFLNSVTDLRFEGKEKKINLKRDLRLYQGLQYYKNAKIGQIIQACIQQLFTYPILIVFYHLSCSI